MPKTHAYEKFTKSVRVVSTTGSIFIRDQIVLGDTSSGTVILNLPSAASALNQVLTIKKTSSANSLIISPYLSETVVDYSSFTLTNLDDTITIVSNGVNWIGVSSNRNRIVAYVKLSGNLSASTSNRASLAYSSLIPGKKYRVCPYISCFTSGNSGQNNAKTLSIIHNGTTIASAALLHNGSGGGDTAGASLQTCGEVFTAVTTTLSANFSMSTSTTLYGNGTTNYTHYYIEDMDII